MRAMSGRGRGISTPLLTLGLAVATLISLSAGSRSLNRTAIPATGAGRIVVNSLADGLEAEPGKTTLLDALARAAAEPVDNLIEFDPALKSTGTLTIRLSQPLIADVPDSGHDRIDGAAIVGGVELDFSAIAEAGITVGGDNRMTLANLTLRGGQQRTILLTENGQLTLDQVVIRDSGGPGVAAFGHSALIASRCVMAANRTHAIELHGEATARLSSVELRENGQSGLAGFDQAAATLDQCRLLKNSEWNLVLTQSSRAELTACLLREGRFAGIDAGDSSLVRGRDCTIEQGGRFGIFATGAASIDLVKSHVSRNGGRGIELQDRARMALDLASVEANQDYGAILFGQARLTAHRSSFADNLGHGISLRGPATGVFTQCNFTRNRYSGVGCLDDRDGGRVRVTECTFTRNGMRPLYRGPLHIDPLAPTPIAIRGKQVECIADPNAVIELYLDRIGEASRYLRSIRADSHGRFQVNRAEVPAGFVMTASATRGEATSEFNVVAGTAEEVVLGALLGRTGPYSDDGGETNGGSVIRRWRPGTHVTFELTRSPSPAVESYVRFLVARIPEWTAGAVTADARIGPGKSASQRGAVVPIRYLDDQSPQLMGRGGVTFMKWDSEGYFESPMQILLALGSDPADACPRVLAHEVGHALGLNHTRVGLLSRMQGSTAPGREFLNDFSPTMTYYDVLALQMLHDPDARGGATLNEVIALARRPRPNTTAIAEARPAASERSYSPPRPTGTSRPERPTQRR